MRVAAVQTGKARNVLFVKGAPEGLLPRCSHLRLEDGTTIRMNDEWRRRLKLQFEEMARRPLRCLALAVKDTNLGLLADVTTPLAGAEGEGVSRVNKRAASMLSDASRFAEIERGLTFVGMVRPSAVLPSAPS